MNEPIREQAAACPATRTPPPGVRYVADFSALITARFSVHGNALCWQRRLAGDFNELITCLGDQDDPVATLDADLLRGLPLSPAGRLAADAMLADVHLLRQHGIDPTLNCVCDYPRDDRGGPISADVFSWHVDSAPCPTDTWLCTYHGPASEGLWFGDARRRCDEPATRAALEALHEKSTKSANFADFLSEHAYDLHYAALPHARPYTFGTGNLWRIATAHPGSTAPPCIHRAPTPAPGDPPRLLLIS